MQKNVRMSLRSDTMKLTLTAKTTIIKWSMSKTGKSVYERRIGGSNEILISKRSS